MIKARIFKYGGGLAVKLPKEIRVWGRELEIFCRGREIILREPEADLTRAFEILASFPDGFADGTEPPPEREDW